MQGFDASIFTAANARRNETNRWFLLALKGYHRSERAIALNLVASPSVLYGMHTAAGRVLRPL
jgi:hypothetical protein